MLTETLFSLLHRLARLAWGPWMLCLILGTGLFLLVRMRFLPFRNFFYALSCVFGRENVSGGRNGRVSPLAAFATELAASVGTGNIAGVAAAMMLGGPGALVWMILSALTGMSVKFAESMLSVRFRTRNLSGQTVGGPMYTLAAAFPLPRLGRFLAVLFAVPAVFASFGMGNMAQANSVSAALREAFGVSEGMTALILTVLVAVSVLGGIGSVSRVALWLVPGMALLYTFGSLAVIAAHPDGLRDGLAQILRMAFSPRAAAGGFGGGLVVSLRDTVRSGVSRGVFSNEAGLGASGITAAAADTDSPVRQGYISMTGVFFDTVLLCTLTGLVLAASGVLGTRDANGIPLTGSALTAAAFSTVFGRAGAGFVAVSSALFAFATIIAWEYQGERAFEFLFRTPGRCLWYRFFYVLVTFLGAVCALEPVWDFADLMNALTAVPNLICVLALSGTVCREMRAYRR